MDARIAERWRARFPGAHVGVLGVGEVDRECATPLDAHKRRVRTLGSVRG